MTNRFRTHLTAWLGLLAMWLIVSAPIVSQLVERARSHENPAVALMEMNMSEMSMGDMRMGNMPMHKAHMKAAARGVNDGSHHASKPSMAACDYCNLLATHAAMPALRHVAESAHMFIMFAATRVLSTRFTPIGAFPAGRPRAPPVVS
ncbi:DUF2946 domain-containing protein [Paraburkholderia dinghuensis]|uniref:DUF2946 domain-containing protein n=1 Tax=Paraburkholderia dinghuensis TaxID=2305225 RepID=A0A3N6Q223_9BURK|nr:DUF2946 domain-containing protein [Paraburkholderia dinghuensis]RQH09120.1 DUF2946 domain-containing protein [Paraburkholderia dinghuensis]